MIVPLDRPTPVASRPLAATGLAAMGLAVVALAVGCGDDGEEEAAFSIEETDAAPADHRFVIPDGSGEAIDRGEPVEILPAEMDVAVGEVLEIVNEDDRGHLIGPFFVGAGETLQQRFTSPGQFQGVCSVHPSGQIVIDVT